MVTGWICSVLCYKTPCDFSLMLISAVDKIIITDKTKSPKLHIYKIQIIFSPILWYHDVTSLTLQIPWQCTVSYSPGVQYMEQILNQKMTDRLFRFIGTVAEWSPNMSINVTSGFNVKTKGNRQRDFNSVLLVTSPKGTVAQNWGRWLCVWDKSREEWRESEGKKKKENDGGRERREEWRVICGSHGPENELLVLTRFNVRMRVRVCVIRVPQSAETKGVSPWHLLSPRNMTHHQGEGQKRKKGGGAHVSLVSPSVWVTVSAHVCECDCFCFHQRLLRVLMCTHTHSLKTETAL